MRNKCGFSNAYLNNTERKIPFRYKSKSTPKGRDIA